jgi:hypothetical protein
VALPRAPSYEEWNDPVAKKSGVSLPGYLALSSSQGHALMLQRQLLHRRKMMLLASNFTVVFCRDFE